MKTCSSTKGRCARQVDDEEKLFKETNQNVSAPNRRLTNSVENQIHVFCMHRRLISKIEYVANTVAVKAGKSHARRR